MRVFAGVIVLAIASTAYADHEPVRDDIVELRHGRWPTPLRFLGWTADGRAVLHEAQYDFQDLSCAPEGSSTLVVVAADGNPVSTDVLQPEIDDRIPYCSDEWPWRVPTTVASRAIRAESAALAALGPLQPAAPANLPRFTIVHGDCWVHLATGVHGRRRTISSVFSIGPKACIDNGNDDSIRDARIVDMHASPDGRAVAVTVEVTTQSLDFYASFLQTVVVSSAQLLQ
jgi:hypothetical protein